MFGISGTVVIMPDLCNPFGVKNGFGFGGLIPGWRSRAGDWGYIMQPLRGRKIQAFGTQLKDPSPGVGRRSRDR